MTTAELEARMNNLEKEVSLLRMRVGQSTPSVAWWDKIAGTFKDDEAHEEAMRLGREYRLATTTNTPSSEE